MSSKLVTSSQDASDNIRRFGDELAKNSELAEIMAYTRAWYAHRDARGIWAFAPSKFIGYSRNTARDYLRSHRDRDGRLTERVLSQWFVEVTAGTPLHSELLGKLQQLFGEFGKTPNRLLRINVLASDSGAASVLSERKRSSKDLSANRITTNPDVCGGRPCIRGMRIRVSDILSLLAAGEERSQILAEYPYLEAEDIEAALEYAAGSVDHRIIRAA